MYTCIYWRFIYRIIRDMWFSIRPRWKLIDTSTATSILFGPSFRQINQYEIFHPDIIDLRAFFSRARGIKKEKKENPIFPIGFLATWTIRKTSFRIIAKPHLDAGSWRAEVERPRRRRVARSSFDQPAASHPASRANRRPKCRAGVREWVCVRACVRRIRTPRGDADGVVGTLGYMRESRVPQHGKSALGFWICPRFSPTAEQPAVSHSRGALLRSVLAAAIADRSLRPTVPADVGGRRDTLVTMVSTAMTLSSSKTTSSDDLRAIPLKKEGNLAYIFECRT